MGICHSTAHNFSLFNYFYLRDFKTTACEETYVLSAGCFFNSGPLLFFTYT